MRRLLQGPTAGGQAVGRIAKWRPWSFGLRSLLFLVAVVATGLGAHLRIQNVQGQRASIAAIQELGGSITVERWAPSGLAAIAPEGFFYDVIAVDVPIHRAPGAWPALGEFPTLKRVRFTCYLEHLIYLGPGNRVQEATSGYSSDDVDVSDWVVEGNLSQWLREVRERLPGVDVGVYALRERIRESIK
jgi:hypothetical protein